MNAHSSQTSRAGDAADVAATEGCDAGLSRRPIAAHRSYHAVHRQPARADYFLHSHGCYELMFIPRGHGRCVVGEHHGPFASGELVLVAPDVPHSWYTDGRLPDGQLLNLLIVWFDRAVVGEPASDVPELAELSPLLRAAQQGVRFGRRTTREAAPLIGSLLHQSDAQGLGTLYRILYTLLTADDTTRLSPRTTLSDAARREMQRVSEICRYLDQHFTDPLELPTVARRFEISVSTLNALLKKYMRRTFLAYLTEKRLEEARRLLRQQAGSITDVAFQAGFGSLATFNRRFRAAEGMSPAQYRQRHEARPQPGTPPDEPA